MVLEHIGLLREPFSKPPDPAFRFPSRPHAEALARLSHAPVSGDAPKAR